jgi:hypothetical protein
VWHGRRPAESPGGGRPLAARVGDLATDERRGDEVGRERAKHFARAGAQQRQAGRARFAPSRASEPEIAGTAATSSARLSVTAHQPSAASSRKLDPPAETWPARVKPASAARPVISAAGSARTCFPARAVTRAGLPGFECAPLERRRPAIGAIMGG